MLPPDTLPTHSSATAARLEQLLLEGLASGDSKAVDKTFWADVRAAAQRLVAERATSGK